MKTNGKRLTTLLGTAVLAMGILVGCSGTATEAAATETVAPATTAETTAETSAMAGETKDQAATEAENTPSADLSGAISVMGSTPVEKLTNALSESFMEKYPNMTMTAEFIGFGARIGVVSSGTADVGNSSRSLKNEGRTDGIAKNIVAIDGIAVVVDGANTVEDLTKQRLFDICGGKIANWKGAGGNNAPVAVIGHESGPGTRNAFEELLELGDMCKYSNELDSTDAVMAKMVLTPDAIGYVLLDVLDDMVKVVKLEDTEPTEESIRTGSYFLSRPFVMVAKGDVSEQNELAKALFDYTYSDEGAEIVKSVGLIAADK